MNKVGSMLNKTVGTMGNKKGEANTYKPAGVHVLGEDYFPQDNLVLSEDSIGENNLKEEKQPQISNSSKILPKLNQKKAPSSSMQEILGLSKQQSQQQQKTSKQKVEESEFMKGFTLINGEKTIHSDKCNIKIDKQLITCKVLMTNYRVYILPDFKKKIGEFSYLNYFPENFFSLLIHKIDKVIKTSNEKSFVFSIQIIMKDQRMIDLVFKNNLGESFLDRLNGLLSLKERPSYTNLAFEYRKNHPIYKKPNFEDGWNIYNPEVEYARQGITNLDYEVSRNKLFRKTKLNENYTLCASYPKFLITVGEITDSDYKCSSEFRTKNRLPALAYFHPYTKGTIWRSAQTKSGLTGNRNRFDEDLLLGIAKISDSKKAYIYDCRPYLSAMANKLKGAGFENVENYPGVDIIFCEIDHIHSARSALHKIYSMLKYNRFTEDKKFLSNFENSNWPNFIYGIIRASINIASSVRKGYSVLIHCSDGWDRCSQLTAFSQLLVDPYFRTIRGYMTLIEKDFLSFGHQFKIRNGYYSKEEYNENQNSPILLQYLDATHQLLVQYPMYFEFNMKFLLFIANSINSGLYGTFLYNNEKEREQKNAKVNTMSCWTEILNNINQYKNPFYEIKTKKDFFFTPIFPFSRIRFWDEFFLPFTQINLNISYDRYINRFSDNFYCNIFGQIKQKNRIISNVMFIDKEKESYIKNLEKLKKENQKLKMALADFTINNNINKELYDKLNKDTIGVVNNLVKEHGGEISLNEELNAYVYKQVKQVEKPKIKEEENLEENIKIEENAKIEDNLKIDEEKGDKKLNEKNEKKSKINQETIDMFFGKAKTVNEKTIKKNNIIEKIETKKSEENIVKNENLDKKEEESDKKEEIEENNEKKEKEEIEGNESNNKKEVEVNQEEENINNVEEENLEENYNDGNGNEDNNEEEINNENNEQELNDEQEVNNEQEVNDEQDVNDEQEVNNEKDVNNEQEINNEQAIDNEIEEAKEIGDNLENNKENVEHNDENNLEDKKEENREENKEEKMEEKIETKVEEKEEKNQEEMKNDNNNSDEQNQK